jgi:hypothetical protein
MDTSEQMQLPLPLPQAHANRSHDGAEVQQSGHELSELPTREAVNVSFRDAPHTSDSRQSPGQHFGFLKRFWRDHVERIVSEEACRDHFGKHGHFFFFSFFVYIS